MSTSMNVFKHIMVSLSSQNYASRREILDSAAQEIARLGHNVTKQLAKKEMFFLNPLSDIFKLTSFAPEISGLQASVAE